MNGQRKLNLISLSSLTGRSTSLNLILKVFRNLNLLKGYISV